MEVVVHERVFREHPSVSLDDVERAVAETWRWQAREETVPTEYVGVGPDERGSALQFIAVAIGSRDDEMWFVFHAMTATEKVLRELGFLT